MNDHDEIFLRYAQFTMNHKKIDVDNDALATNVLLSSEETIDSVGDCKADKNYCRKGTSNGRDFIPQ